MYGMLLHPVNGLWFERSKDKRKKDDFKLGVITLDLSMFKDKDGKEIYKKLFDKLEKERLT